MQPRFVSIWYRKTDVQCKNRIDTRLEKSKPGPSQWPFFSRLDLLIGPKSAPSLKKPNPSSVPFIKPPYPPPNTHCRPSLTSAIKHRNPNSNAAMSSSGLINSLGSSESSHGEFGRIKDDEEEDENDGDNGLFDVVAARKRQRSWGSSGGGGEDRAFGEFARAIMKFAVVYECIENKAAADDGAEQRMAFTKNLELQPDAEFMDAQVELEKMKQPKYALGSGEQLILFIYLC